MEADKPDAIYLEQRDGTLEVEEGIQLYESERNMTLWQAAKSHRLILLYGEIQSRHSAVLARLMATNKLT